MREFIFFVFVRGVCAVLSYGCYLLMLIWFRYEVAYVGSYVIGIGLAYLASAMVVFKQPLNRKSAMLFPLVYLIQFVLGLLLLRLAVETFGVPEWAALAVSVILTLPLTYYMSKWAVRVGQAPT